MMRFPSTPLKKSPHSATQHKTPRRTSSTKVTISPQLISRKRPSKKAQQQPVAQDADDEQQSSTTTTSRTTSTTLTTTTTAATTTVFNTKQLTSPNGTIYKTLTPTSAENWRAWLSTQTQQQEQQPTTNAQSSGIWLVYYKKSSQIPSLEYSVAVDHALCFGWIDSTRKSITAETFVDDEEGAEYARKGEDDPRYMQLFTPRNVKKSTWSKVNKAKVELLIASKLMTQAGLDVIDAAKANGQWESLDDVENMVLPDDLLQVFESSAANLAKMKKFDNLSRSNKRMMLLRLTSAKRKETRDKRIQEILSELS